MPKVVDHLSNSHKSKMMILAMSLAVLGIIQESSGALTPYITPDVMGIVSMALGAIIAVLRIYTTTSLADK